MKKIFAIITATALITGLTACGSSQKEELMKSGSGYLADYSRLQEVKSDKEHNFLLRWVSPDLENHHYTSIEIDEVSFYPEAKASDKVTIDELNSIVAYTNTTLQAAAKSTGKVVTQADASTMKLQAVITTATISDQGMSAYQYIPVAFVVSAATDSLNHWAPHIMLEGKLVDSKSGELLATIVRTSIGKDVDEKAMLTLDMVKPAINDWANYLSTAINKDLIK